MVTIGGSILIRLYEAIYCFNANYFFNNLQLGNLMQNTLEEHGCTPFGPGSKDIQDLAANQLSDPASEEPSGFP